MVNHIQKSEGPTDPATSQDTSQMARFDVDSFRRAINEMKSSVQAQNTLMKMFTNNNEPASKLSQNPRSQKQKQIISLGKKIPMLALFTKWNTSSQTFTYKD